VGKQATRQVQHYTNHLTIRYKATAQGAKKGKAGDSEEKCCSLAHREPATPFPEAHKKEAK